MKYTQYFLYTRQRPDRAYIKDGWIDFTSKNPIRTEIQSDARIRKWAKMEEEGKYLRIILLEETIHNAFFDRDFKEV
jgi:hypothetical protein